MTLPRCALLLGIVLTLLLEPISGKHGGGGHSYPKSGGLSGGGHQSGGLSGGGHSYPTSSNNHGYSPSSNNHGYPPSTGLSGGGSGYPASNPGGHRTTNYHYSPPSQISYTPTHGGAPVSYPVYQGQPPTYVYQYKDSGSKYGTLLAGLALMNLGTLGVAAYAAHQANQNHGSSYTPEKGEVCKFAVKKDNEDYEETRIDCQIISGLILQDMEAKKSANNSTITTTTVTNVTMVNTTNVGGEQATTVAPVLGNVLYSMLPNGTLVPVNATEVHEPGMPGVLNATHNETAHDTPNHSATSSVVVTTTTTNTTLVNALDVKGAPVEVTPGMQCFVIRNSPTSNMRKTVPCGLLQTYADKSIRPNSAARNVPMFTIVVASLVYCVA